MVKPTHFVSEGCSWPSRLPTCSRDVQTPGCWFTNVNENMLDVQLW